MIEVDNTLYPIHSIREIRIDRDKLTLVIYFLNNFNSYPITINFENLKALEEKVSEFKGENINGRKKILFG